MSENNDLIGDGVTTETNVPKKRARKKVAKKRAKPAAPVKAPKAVKAAKKVADKPKRKYTRRGSNVIGKVDNKQVLNLLVDMRGELEAKKIKLSPKLTRSYARAVKSLTS